MAQPTKCIFILSGESNMAGRGGVDKHNHWDGVEPLQCASDPTKIFRLNAELRWEVATEPLHRDIDNKNTCGVGPGMVFANSIKYLLVGQSEIGLVPCAVGGTAIKEWGRGSPLYANMVKRAKAATATTIPTPTTTDTSSSTSSTAPTATSTSTSTSTATSLVTATSASTATSTATTTTTTTKAAPTPTLTHTPTDTVGSNEIKALLWYQGESDAKSGQDANSYKEKMEELIANIRADLNLPKLPVIQVALASGDVKFIEKIRKAQLEMKVENVVCVDAKGLPLKEDNLHLTTQAQVQLGHMLAKAYIKHFAD